MPARISMTGPQRDAILALPDDEAMIVRHYSLNANDLAAINGARSPETRLGYALQLCCLRYPGRHLRRGELLPAVMLDHIAEQIGVDAEVIADFARRTPTRYDQLLAIKAHFGFTDLTKPMRATLRGWLETEAVGLINGHVLLGKFLDELRVRKIVIPGITVVERMAAEAMHAAEIRIIADIDNRLDTATRSRLDALIADKTHDRQSRFSWLREPTPRVTSASLVGILDKIALVRGTGKHAVAIDRRYEPRMEQFAREGVRYTAQAFQQMGPARRHVILVATLREFEATVAFHLIMRIGRQRFQQVARAVNLRTGI